MPYDSQPAGEEMPGETPEGGSEDQGEPSESIHIPTDALPPGIKVGDTLTCTAMDDNGCTFDMTSSTAKDEGTPWEEDFRKSMSPQTPQEEPA